MSDTLLATAVSLSLATITTVLLLLMSPPLAWWLARTRSRARSLVEALVALPLVLPPTVIGFYLLLAMAPDGFLGAGWHAATGQALAFSFSGLVIGSLLYSLPFVVQPLSASFRTVDPGLLEAAAALGADPRRRFLTLILPMHRRALLAAAVLGFAHTVGEFGIVLMIGGNIPGKTRVVSTQIYGHVEAMEYAQAHWLAGGMVLFSFVVLLCLALLKNRGSRVLP